MANARDPIRRNSEPGSESVSALTRSTNCTNDLGIQSMLRFTTTPTLADHIGHVLGLRAEPQMAGVYAIRSIAMMVHLKARWNRPMVHQPGQDVRPQPAATVPYLAISTALSGPAREVAARHRIARHALEEPALQPGRYLQRQVGEEHDPIRASAEPPCPGHHRGPSRSDA